MFIDIYSDYTKLKILYFSKIILNIFFILLPVILLLLLIKKVFDYVTSNDDKKYLNDAINKSLICLLLFFVPTSINYIFSLLSSNTGVEFAKLYNDANSDNIKMLDTKVKEEVAGEDALIIAQKKELLYKDENELKDALNSLEKVDEALEQKNNPQVSNQEQNNGTFQNETGTSSSGTLKVVNGVFYLPNKRASKDSDIPKQSGMNGLNPVFANRLKKLMDDGAKKGYKITVSQGWRSYSSQISIWNKSSRPCSVRTKWVACPGGSRHGWGIAADLRYNGTGCSGSWNCNAAAKWVHDNAKNYGLKFRLPNEPWHIEPLEVKGGGFGTCDKKC